MRRIRVVLADDHAIVRHGVKKLIETQPDLEVVGELSDGYNVVEFLEKNPSDVLLLDLSLPRVSGVECLRRIKSRGVPVRVIVLSMYPEDQLALHLLREGASGYLSKDRSPSELLVAIREVAGGGQYLTDTLRALEHEVGTVETVLPHESLTPRESQVFQRLIVGRTVSDIAAELDLNASTVSNHVARIKEKLQAQSVGDILRYAHRVGLLS
jgi:DNA-binding NarL/FixJ family response regulator